jgi:hypothetical protein
MNYAPHDWVSVPLHTFNEFIAASNVLRENWSDGELLYEKINGERRLLGFVTLKGICLVPRILYAKHFTTKP